LSSEKLTVGTESSQTQKVICTLSIDQQEIRFDVAFAIACPISAQIVISPTRRERATRHPPDLQLEKTTSGWAKRILYQFRAREGLGYHNRGTEVAELFSLNA
jgi:hypothetical protein